jgi:hypothetical protein
MSLLASLLGAGGARALPPGTAQDDNISIGSRVQRGPSWNKGDQDGGDGKLGTVIGHKSAAGGAFGEYAAQLPPACAVVTWDTGKRYFYAVGARGEHMLALAEERAAPGSEPGAKVTADNVRLGSKVQRGPDWSHGDQDGGVGHIGTVLGWCDAEGGEAGEYAGGRYRLAARISWSGTGKANYYRIGKGGLYDLSFADVSKRAVARRRWRRAMAVVRCAVAFKTAGRDHVLLFQPPLAPQRPVQLPSGGGSQGGGGVGSICAGWRPPRSGQELTAYEVQCGPPTFGRWSTAPTPQGGGGATGTVLEGLTPGGAYVLRVRAQNCNGWSAWSPNSAPMLAQDAAAMAMQQAMAMQRQAAGGNGYGAEGGARAGGVPYGYQQDGGAPPLPPAGGGQLGAAAAAYAGAGAAAAASACSLAPEQRELFGVCEEVHAEFGSGGTRMLALTVSAAVDTLNAFQEVVDAAAAEDEAAAAEEAAAARAGEPPRAGGGPGGGGPGELAMSELDFVLSGTTGRELDAFVVYHAGSDRVLRLWAHHCRGTLDMRERLQSAKLWRGIDSAHVLKVLDARALQVPGAGRSDVCVLTEGCEGGTLAERVRARPIAEPQLWDLFEQLAQALADVHAQQLVHRSVSLGAAYFAKGGSNIVRLGGLERCLKTWQAGLEAGAGPRVDEEHCPPELADGHLFSPKSDVWCLGCCLLEVAAGHAGVPFRGSARQLQCLRSASFELFAAQEGVHAAFGLPREAFTEGVLRVVYAALQAEPEQRPSAAELCGLLRTYKTEARAARAALAAAASPGGFELERFLAARRARRAKAGDEAEHSGGARRHAREADSALHDGLVVFGVAPAGLALDTGLALRHWLVDAMDWEDCHVYHDFVDAGCACEMDYLPDGAPLEPERDEMLRTRISYGG